MNVPILRSRAFLFGLAVLACALAYGAWHWLFSSPDEQSTNDAFVSADYTIVSPKVGGIVQQVLVEDNQAVKAGQLLLTLDDRDYQAAVAAARAEVAGAVAQLANARATSERLGNLPDGVDMTGMAQRMHTQVVTLTSSDLYLTVAAIALAMIVLIPILPTRIYPPRAA